MDRKKFTSDVRKTYHQILNEETAKFAHDAAGDSWSTTCLRACLCGGLCTTSGRRFWVVAFEQIPWALTVWMLAQLSLTLTLLGFALRTAARLDSAAIPILVVVPFWLPSYFISQLSLSKHRGFVDDCPAFCVGIVLFFHSMVGVVACSVLPLSRDTSSWVAHVYMGAHIVSVCLLIASFCTGRVRGLGQFCRRVCRCTRKR